MELTLFYIWVRFGGREDDDHISFKVGEGGVKTIRLRKDNFAFVVYEDRAMVLNLNQARYIEIQEPRP